jgi:hypothetical protein
VIRSGWKNAPLRRLLLVSAAALIPVLAGCEAGNNAPTLEFHPPTDSAATVAGSIAIRNVFILGAPLGSALQPGQSASLFFSLINDGSTDRLLSISAPGNATSVHLPGPVVVAQNKPILWNGPQPQAYLADLTSTLTSGSSIKLVLHFQKEGAVTLQVPIFPRATHYVTYSSPPSPTPSPSATGTRRHHRASATPSVTPTPSPSAS